MNPLTDRGNNRALLCHQFRIRDLQHQRIVLQQTMRKCQDQLSILAPLLNDEMAGKPIVVDQDKLQKSKALFSAADSALEARAVWPAAEEYYWSMRHHQKLYFEPRQWFLGPHHCALNNVLPLKSQAASLSHYRQLCHDKKDRITPKLTLLALKTPDLPLETLHTLDKLLNDDDSDPTNEDVMRI